MATKTAYKVKMKKIVQQFIHVQPIQNVSKFVPQIQFQEKKNALVKSVMCWQLMDTRVMTSMNANSQIIHAARHAIILSEVSCGF